MDATYNDIQEWKYGDLVSVFGGSAKKAKTFAVKTKQEAENLFLNEDFAAASCLQVSGLGLFQQGED